MLIIKFISKLIKILRSAASPGQIAGGFVLGMVLGLTPLWKLHNLITVILLVILNVNISMALFSFAIFSGIAYLIDPLFHGLGYFLLADARGLKGLWTAMYNMPILALSNFNNTVVMGSLVSSLILVTPVFLMTKKGVVLYRERIDSRIQKAKIMQALKSSKLYSLYETVRDWKG
jgi:uncharacterized protein (TIGR03546 family)